MARNEKTTAVATTSADEARDAAIKAAVEQALAARQKRVKDAFANIEPKVEHVGKTLTLPADPEHMSYAKGIEWLEALRKADEEPVAVHEPINAFPLDGAVAFSRAMTALFGFSKAVATETFFGSQPPTMVSVEVGFEETVTVMWGAFEVPGVAGKLHTSIAPVKGKMCFVIQGKVARKSLRIVHRLAEMTREYVAQASIYRGKAITLHTDGEGNINFNEPPSFLDLRGVRAEELVFSADLEVQVRVNLFTPIEYRAECKKAGIPLKRGVLLEGPFGTGKTLCAHVTAQKCEANGWTFVTVGRVSALKGALEFAALYQPCVIFVEDIDREVQGERTAEMDDILNVIDGVVSKGKDIITVLTSNEAEKINRAMLRPGRLDAVLHIDAPDAEAAERLMRLYGRGSIFPDTPLPISAKELAGQIPAVIREAVERAKLHAIARTGTSDITLLDSDIASAAWGMKRHLELLRGAVVDPATTEHRLGAAMIGVIEKSLANGAMASLRDQVAEIHDHVGA